MTKLRGEELGQSREFVAFIATCMAMAAVSIDMLLPAFPDIRRDFHLAADSTAPSGLVTAFFLGLAFGMLLYGPLSDRYGRKRMLHAGLVIYAAGAMAASFMPTLGGVLAARVAWGFGGAAPRSLALAMVRDTQHGNRMARTMSQVMLTFILVPILAPGLGTLLIAALPWRIVFWLPAVAAGGLALWSARLPETLAPEQRRSVSFAALGEAVAAVSRSRQTVGYGLAVAFLFGIMTGYVGGAELVIDKVYGQGDHFALFFGLVACLLGLGAFVSGRLVMRLGLERLVRVGACYVVTAAAFLAMVTVTTRGRPPLIVLGLGTALVLGGITLVVPSCNTAAMTPVPHVAGMASALLGFVSTAGGALLGSVIDGAYDGSARPFGVGALLLAGAGATAILVVAGRSQRVEVPVGAIS